MRRRRGAWRRGLGAGEEGQVGGKGGGGGGDSRGEVSAASPDMARGNLLAVRGL